LINREASGLEWWVQSKSNEETSDNNNNNNNNNNNQTSNGVDLHYDKDEELAANFGIGVFPQISTVTYLTDCLSGTTSPTVVLETTAKEPVESEIRKCFVSVPEVGKHISFDGRFLHGAPSQLKSLSGIDNNNNNNNNENSSKSNTYRLTFLVNIWINYRPCKVSILPADLLRHLHTTSSPANLLCSLTISSSSSSEMKTVNVTDSVSSDPDLGEWESIPFVSDKSDWGCCRYVCYVLL
jgi:hypothetical protein